VIGVALGFGSHTYTIYLLLTWLPTYLSSALHIDLLHSFLYTGMPWLIGATCEMLVGGWLISRLIRLGWNADRVHRTVLLGGTSMGLGIYISILPSVFDGHINCISLFQVKISQIENFESTKGHE
jgi:hypothetical protein